MYGALYSLSSFTPYELTPFFFVDMQSVCTWITMWINLTFWCKFKCECVIYNVLMNITSLCKLYCGCVSYNVDKFNLLV